MSVKQSLGDVCGGSSVSIAAATPTKAEGYTIPFPLPTKECRAKISRRLKLQSQTTDRTEIKENVSP
jgi:hypothetical protein